MPNFLSVCIIFMHLWMHKNRAHLQALEIPRLDNWHGLCTP